MATANKIVTRKNGIPVRRFWKERVKRTDTHFVTTYPVYFTGQGNTVWSLTDEKAPRTLEEAKDKATVLIEDEGSPQTNATIYELRAVARVGTEFDWKLHEQEQYAAQRVQAGPTFRLHSTTATLPEFPRAQVDSDVTD